MTQVIETDLYSLIYPVKEQQFEDYGRVWDHLYEEKMLALLEGKPQQRLKEDRLSREIVRSILTATGSYDSRSTWVRMEGNKTGMTTYGATKFPKTPNHDLRESLYALKGDGLLDVMFGACGDPGLWCFESEIIYWKETTTSSGKKQKSVSRSKARFQANAQLREALEAMLKPFSSEKPMYAHPKRDFRDI